MSVSAVSAPAGIGTIQPVADVLAHVPDGAVAFASTTAPLVGGVDVLSAVASRAPQLIVNGLLVGALFAAVAVGFALIWGVVDIINLAHGEMVMLGAYVTYWSARTAVGGGDVALWVGLATVPVAVAALFVVGYLLQRYVVSHVTGTDLFLTLLVTFGLSIMIQQLAIRAWTADPRTLPIAFDETSLNLAGIVVPKMKLIAFAGAIVLTVALWAFLTYTRQGRAIRAVAQNDEAAALLGIDVKHTRAMTFGLSSAIAGGAGSFIAMILQVEPQMGLIYTLKSFIIVVFGGIGSIPGALVGGLALGSIEEMVAGFLGSTWTLAASFTILILLLVVKPKGLFGSALEGEE